jgi:endogenous inhibitor of DNA gyrase (YacG/DUF329 family)
MASSVACTFFFDAEPVGEPSLVALDACALCAKPLGRGADIFMYRGDTPFCSEDCRYEQMQLDAIRARQAASRRQQQLSQRTAESQRERQSRKVSVES